MSRSSSSCIKYLLVASFVLITETATIDSQSKLRGHISFGEPENFGPEPGPVGKKPDIIKDAEEVHSSLFLPFASWTHVLLITWTQLLVISSVWIILVLLLAFWYKGSSTYQPDRGKASVPLRTKSEFTEWQSEWYECHRYPGVFAWACFCPCIRWAHNMDLLQFLDYWPAFCLFFVLELINQLTAFVFVGIFMTIMLVFYRQKTKKLFGMNDHSTCCSYTSDFIGLCFCWPCLIAQEANHLSEAAKKGWTKDLATKSGVFSAGQTPRGHASTAQSNPTSPITILNIPANLPHHSPATSAFMTPRDDILTPRTHT